MITFEDSFNPALDRQNVGPDLDLYSIMIFLKDLFKNLEK